MVVPIYKQIHKRSGAIEEDCEKSLLWWLMVLKEGMCEVRTRVVNFRMCVHILFLHRLTGTAVDPQQEPTHAPLV